MASAKPDPDLPSARRALARHNLPLRSLTWDSGPAGRDRLSHLPVRQLPLWAVFMQGAISGPRRQSPAGGYAAGGSFAGDLLADAGAAAVLSLRSVLDQERERGESATRRVQRCSALQPTSSRLPIAPAPVGTRRLRTSSRLLQYTSGSTGNARGVMVTHANLISNQNVLAVVLGLRAGEVVVNWLPLYHDMELIGGVLYSAYMGLTCYLDAAIDFSAAADPLAASHQPLSRGDQPRTGFRISLVLGAPPIGARRS